VLALDVAVEADEFLDGVVRGGLGDRGEVGGALDDGVGPAVGAGDVV